MDKLFTCHVGYPEMVWIRLWNGYGIAISKTPLTFSERYGYKKYLNLVAGYRVTGICPSMKTKPPTTECGQVDHETIMDILENRSYHHEIDIYGHKMRVIEDKTMPRNRVRFAGWNEQGQRQITEMIIKEEP